MKQLILLTSYWNHRDSQAQHPTIQTISNIKLRKCFVLLLSKDSDSTIDICTTNRFSIGEMNNCTTYTLHEPKEKCQDILTEMKEIRIERKTADNLKSPKKKTRKIIGQKKPRNTQKNINSNTSRLFGLRHMNVGY